MPVTPKDLDRTAAAGANKYERLYAAEATQRLRLKYRAGREYNGHAKYSPRTGFRPPKKANTIPSPQPSFRMELHISYFGRKMRKRWVRVEPQTEVAN